MPLSKYDQYFGGKGGATKAHAAMAKEYGAKKGESVFYGLKNKRAAARSTRGVGGGRDSRRTR